MIEIHENTVKDCLRLIKTLEQEGLSTQEIELFLIANIKDLYRVKSVARRIGIKL